MHSLTNHVRMNISLPSELVENLRKTVPPRGISRFIAQASLEKIERLRRDEAFKKLLAGPPAFPHIKNPYKWVRKIRKNDLIRLKKLGV